MSKKTSQTNPALAMLERQRAAHDAAQRTAPNFGTVQVWQEDYDYESEWRKVRLIANRDLCATIPVARRLQIIYAPLIAKTLCNDLCITIEQMLKDSNVTDTKTDIAYLKRWRNEWEKELFSPDMPKEAVDELRILTQWWREDGTDNILKSLRYAYSNHLGKIEAMQTNTRDFLAWILTAREICRAAARFDDVSLEYLKSLPESKELKLRRNKQDYSYKLQEFTTRLLVSAFGQDFDPTGTQIETGRKALFNRLALYDALSALSEYWAKDAIERAHKRCPAERCKDCELRKECKTLASVTKKMRKS